MRIDAHENADKARLRRDPSGALRSNYRPAVGPYALNGKGRTAYIDGLERERTRLLSTGDREGAKRYAIQAEFERAAQIADSHQRQADATRDQQYKDEHERRAYEARAQMTEAQLKLAELDKRSQTEWAPTAEARVERFASEVEQRKAEERKLAEQLAAERSSDDYQRQVEAREQSYRERIQPEHQQRYDALVDDVRRRFANTHGKDPDSYTLSDRERGLTHKLIVDQGYGQGPLSEPIREVAPQAPTQDADEPRLDAKRFTVVSDRAAADSLRNDQLLRQPAPNEQAQRSEPVESVKMAEAGYVAQRHADHIAYSKEGQEKPAVRDYGDRISADPKHLQNEEARRDVIAMVGERFPNGFQIRTSDEERKQEFAREAVRQGLGDKVTNPELRDFINDYKQQYAEEQRAAQVTSQRDAEPQRQEPTNVEREPGSERQAAVSPVESRSQAPDARQQSDVEADRLARRPERREEGQLKLNVLNSQAHLTDTQREAFSAGLDAARQTADPELRRQQELDAYRQAAADLKANEQQAQQPVRQQPEPQAQAERAETQRPTLQDPLSNPSLGPVLARPEPAVQGADTPELPQRQPDDVQPMRAPTLGGSPLEPRVDTQVESAPLEAPRDAQASEPAPVEPVRDVPEQTQKQSFDWGPGASDPSDSELAKLDEQRRQNESAPAETDAVQPMDDGAQEEQQETQDESEVVGEVQAEGVHGEASEAEPDLSHLPEEVAQSLRESMAAEAELRAQREQEAEQESQQQSSGSQTL